ncbi:MAG: hypothetical protein QFB87_05610 [Patescibacteria group bacterium]|nr:hypothetical protein [Patescibacteria group bacterium]
MNLELWNQRAADGGYIPNASDDPLYLNDVEWTAMTYMDLARVKFTSTEAMQKAKAITGWDEWEEDTLAIRFHKKLIMVGDKFYADWGTNNE